MTKKIAELALVVIGKNSIDNLTNIYTAAYVSRLEKFLIDLIFVDSSSSDSSVHFMKDMGFRCFVISPDGAICASAGRYVGVEESTSKYILFLDSDMEIENIESFFSRVADFFHEGSNDFSGLVGDVIDRYHDGTTRRRIRVASKAGDATSFGGFVLLEREALIESGGWNYRLPANEELDLYSRLKENNKRVCYTNGIHVIHHTEVPSPLYELLSLYLPLRPARYGALGKVFRWHLLSKRGWQLLRLEFEAFAFVAFSILLFINLNFSLSVFVIYEVVLLLRRGVRYNLVVPGMALNLLFGFFMPISKKGVKYEKI